MINKNISFINFSNNNKLTSTEKSLYRDVLHLSLNASTSNKLSESPNRKLSSRLDWNASFKPSGVSSYSAASEPAAKREVKHRTVPFTHYLTPSGQKILPQLIKSMEKGTKPEDFAIMMVALESHKLLETEIDKISNFSQFHRSITEAFGPEKVGSRYGLKKTLIASTA